jgi:menaquinone-dependent protoporphyrinogen IX oxidase
LSSNKTLIAYVSKQGATVESANKIAEILRSKYGLEVDLVDIKEQQFMDLTQYVNVIIGSGVRAGRVYGKALKFLKNDWTGKKVAFYVSSAWAGTPGSHDDAKARFADKTLAKYPNLNPVSTEAFGGRIKYVRKLMVDNTDMAKVEAWAEELGKKFTQ